MTCLELKTASQKSRICEMEGSLNMAHENSAKIRKQAMVYQEKIAFLSKEVKQLRVIRIHGWLGCRDNLIQLVQLVPGMYRGSPGFSLQNNLRNHMHKN